MMIVVVAVFNNVYDYGHGAGGGGDDGRICDHENGIAEDAWDEGYEGITGGSKKQR